MLVQILASTAGDVETSRHATNLKASKMGPPINMWPCSHPKLHTSEDKRLIFTLVENVRNISFNCTVVLVLVQLFFSLSYVTAGPVILSLDYLQGPVPLARNIRHLPCVSRRTGEEGLCMFAIDCLKSNGSHLGTCIDRFYFGSCCQIPDKTILPNIINNIDDNTIDTSNFVHPQEDKLHSINKLPNLYKKPVTTTKKPVEVTEITTDKAQHRTDPDDKIKLTTLDNTIEDKTTNAVSNIQDTTEAIKTTQKAPGTESPIKLSTFQSVFSDLSNINPETTPKPVKIETTEATTTTERPKPSRKPIRPTYKPRPTYRPTNFTRPPYTGTGKPRPTKPLTIVNTTRKPPFRIPPKRPPTKKPIPIPPRLNITIIPQSTSSRPAFTRPSVPIITYINTTVSKAEERTTPTTISTTLSTTTTEPTTTSTTPRTTTTTSTTTITTTTTTTTTTTPSPTTIEEEETEMTETDIPVVTEPATTTEVKFTEQTTEAVKQTDRVTEKVSERPTTVVETTEFKETTVQEVTEKETERPTEAEIPTTTEFPPFVTWSSNVDTATKTPEKPTTQADDVWSPITPPEGWLLLTVPPTSSSTASTTDATTSEPVITESSPTVLTSQSSQAPTTAQVETTTIAQSSTILSSSTSSTTVSEQMEFTVNVTLSPTPITTTEKLSTGNITSETPLTEGQTNENKTESTTVIATTTEGYNMSNYKEVCGRRIWPQARIVGGAKSSFGQWPWQISLRQYRTSTYLHKCGAALLNENWAITAAHCVEHVPPSELLVRLGEHDLANEDEPYGFAERRVQIIASHPHFDPATFEYDLALLRFYEPVTFQPNILPVCVPDNDDDYVGKTAHVTGWGRLYDEGPLPSVLQEVEVPIINNTACEAMYQAAGYNEHIPNIFICAGWKKGGADSCEGDSGGPMVIQRDKDNRFVLGGIISWGIGCAEPNQPGVYTRISEFRDWINQILQF
ncbi:unnamed protein product [Leptosia nina]|uniref:Peptidase S1 domain-containing protein n=1 Tax=Leptosia nina TaxID=320188 RepID=A0AAV1JK26_9NEOP